MTTNAGIKQHADGSIVPYLGEGRMFSSVSNKLNTSSTVAGVSCTLDYNTLDYAKGIKSPAVQMCIRDSSTTVSDRTASALCISTRVMRGKPVLSA